MKLKQKSCFLEFVVRLLQKALLEDELDLVLEWKQIILNWLSRCVCMTNICVYVCVEHTCTVCCRCFILHVFAVCNICRRDEALFELKKHSGLPVEESKDFTASVIEFNTKVSFLKPVDILKFQLFVH